MNQNNNNSSANQNPTPNAAPAQAAANPLDDDYLGGSSDEYAHPNNAANPGDNCGDLANFDHYTGEVTPEQPRDFSPLPDGNYQAEVIKAYFDWVGGNNGGARYRVLKMQLQVLTGPHAKRVIFKTIFIRDTPDSIKFFLSDLLACGLDVKGRGMKISQIPAHLGELIGVQINITQKTKFANGKEVVNHYFGQRLSVKLPSVAAARAGEEQPPSGHPASDAGAPPVSAYDDDSPF